MLAKYQYGSKKESYAVRHAPAAVLLFRNGGAFIASETTGSTGGGIP
ncbi:MAG: hypothetical protein IJV40_10160 [Oscillospiraceae bacterium]|nr:hypothetical protein [Oscillospiraceae bacterium]